jgi:hydrogenase maturation protease
MPLRPPSILVLTCGNPLAGDDALGPAVGVKLTRYQRYVARPFDHEATKQRRSTKQTNIELQPRMGREGQRYTVGERPSTSSSGVFVASSLRGEAVTGRETVAQVKLEVVEAETSAGMLLDCLAGRDAVIVVDAVRMPGSAPGRIVDVDWFAADRPELLGERPLSTHGWSIGQELDLARAMGLLPACVRLLGATIASAKTGGLISPAVRGCAGALCRRIVTCARRTACCGKELSHAECEQSGRVERPD